MTQIVLFFKIGGSPDGSDNGLLEDEVEAAIATLQSLANTLECSCVKLRERKEMRGVVLQYLIRRMLDQSGIYNYVFKKKLSYLILCLTF